MLRAILFVAVGLVVGCGRGETPAEAASKTLQPLNEDQALAVGLKGLTDEDPVNRRWAVASLVNAGSKAKSALPELKKLLNDADRDVRRAAAEAVRNIEAAK